MKNRQLLIKIITALSIGLTATAFSKNGYADDISSISSQANYFSNNDDHPDNNQAVQHSIPVHPLTIPTKTPTPIEGYRWNHRRIYIYMQADDPNVKQAFRDAVKAWNHTKIIHFVWTHKASKADVFAKSGDLSADSVNSNVGTTHADLGSTQSSYDPGKHALLTATSILDPNQLRFSSRAFRAEVAEHELGHALGLAHAPEYAKSVMIPHNIRSGITKLDRKTLKLLYQ